MNVVRNKNNFMILIKIIITSLFLFFGSKYLKLKNTKILPAIQVALPYHAFLYLFNQNSNPIYMIIGFILIITFIKYFYKIDLKQSVFLWLFTLLAGLTTMLIAGTLGGLYQLIS